MSTLFVTRGLPASGKTTYAKQWVSEDPLNRVRINRDDTREMLYGLEGYDYNFDKEKSVTLINHAAIREMLKRGKDVIVDDTNLRIRFVRDLRAIAQSAGSEFITLDWFADVPLETCLERNAHRSAPVPDYVIRNMWGKFLRNGPPLVPEEPEEVGEMRVHVYEEDPSLPSAYLFDIDGTLALMGTRNPFDETRVSEDRVNTPVAEMLATLWDAGHYIMIFSGRKDSCQEETEKWLAQNEICFHEIHMRPAADGRKDSEVKYDMFNAYARDLFNVRGVFDDRDQVVRLWRDLGVQCYQVAYGDF